MGYPIKPDIETEPTIEGDPTTPVQTKSPESPPASPVKAIEQPQVAAMPAPEEAEGKKSISVPPELEPV